jgi:hypothetical protein
VDANDSCKLLRNPNTWRRHERISRKTSTRAQRKHTILRRNSRSHMALLPPHTEISEKGAMRYKLPLLQKRAISPSLCMQYKLARLLPRLSSLDCKSRVPAFRGKRSNFPTSPLRSISQQPRIKRGSQTCIEKFARNFEAPMPNAGWLINRTEVCVRLPPARLSLAFARKGGACPG